ncbi:hypothetical protein BDY19DRAFT_948542 [Irpex rosettiformis]|uniref:Uncharacterized protein n=1 Tax=Irpex rosettiformis TaxID=378272 RepID=A0ACB8U383_9APHY|nr:hypothetical protein BDY19DRAFT_948542 [Irpex rosettiformis]
MNVYTHQPVVTEPLKQVYIGNVPVYRAVPPTPMLSPPSSVAVSTPSLVARSLTSSPSSSTILDEPEEFYRTEGRADDAHDLCRQHLDSYTFDTEDTPWFTGRTLLPYLHAHAPYAAQQQTVVFVPNPHALPYLPTITRKRRRADPTACDRVEVSWRPNHAWLRPFRAGTVANWTQGRRDYAKLVVDAGPWDTSLLSELAGRFIERAAEGLSDDLIYVAPYAREVYAEFQRRFGGDPAEVFAQQLRQCLLSEFRAWWLQTLPSSIYHLSRTSPCPPHALPFHHLSSALAVAEFAGDLFAHSLTAGHYLLLCINMLLDRLSILEEVYALHTIVHHAGEAMYGRLQSIDFVNKLQRQAGLIQPNASVFDHPNVVAEVSRVVEELATLVNGWANARLTPSPSECSDLVSEYSDHNPDMANYHEVTTASTPDTPPGLVLPSAAREAGKTTGRQPYPSDDVSNTCGMSLIRAQPDHGVSWAQVVKT